MLSGEHVNSPSGSAADTAPRFVKADDAVYVVDDSACNGCGMCATVCPEVFRMDGYPGRKIAILCAETVPDRVREYFNIARECCGPEAIRAETRRRRSGNTIPTVHLGPQATERAAGNERRRETRRLIPAASACGSTEGDDCGKDD